MIKTVLFWMFLVMLMFSCSDKSEHVFELRQGSDVGIDFRNDLRQTIDLNILDYMYFFNGGGVASGDFNNDGLIDLYFTGNQVQNEMYLNKGDLTFAKVTEKAFPQQKNAWSTGVSLVDINSDGMLDMYVCQLGNFKKEVGENQLWICTGMEDGIPRYENRAKEYGLDFSGFSTQSVFFDYDLDGDLDMYLLNHSVHSNNTFGKRTDFSSSFHPLSGDRIYRNDQGKYTDVTRDAGIYSNEIGYGLGIGIADLNNDGYPDIYIGNDFHENDYLYINQKNGTFKESINEMMMHTSRFSMGTDLADINNDALVDVMSLDMMPFENKILKSSEGEDPVSTFKFKLNFGYNHQYAKNCLQINNGNGTFSDVAMQSGVHATDWSWSTLLFDIDNDSEKDIFVSNGIPKRMNDIDYINFISNNEIQARSDFGALKSSDVELLNSVPEIKIENQIFLHNGTYDFRNVSQDVGNSKASYSNGMIYADLDNDGDLDVVTNNINEDVFVYENKLGAKNRSIEIELNGPVTNPKAIGTKIRYKRSDGSTVLYEKYPTRGFQSSMEADLLMGIGNDTLGMLEIIWPDGTFEIFQVSGEDKLTFQYEPGLPLYYRATAGNDTTSVVVQRTDHGSESHGHRASVHDEGNEGWGAQIIDYTEEINLSVSHMENPFVEFDREAMIPHAASTEGPALAVGDLNGDGLDDFFLGGAKRIQGQVFFQTADGNFEKQLIAHIAADSICEDTDAVIEDFNGDGILDLMVLGGGNEYGLKSEYNRPRLYVQEKDSLRLMKGAFTDVGSTGQRIGVLDIDNDGDKDVVIASRSLPWRYGDTPQSYVLQNDGHGIFTDVAADVAEEFQYLGMLKTCEVVDMDKDGDDDFVIAVEWGGIYWFDNQAGTFVKKQITADHGFWNLTLLKDFDNDGDLDVLAGNLGLNSKLKASEKEPVEMLIYDFDHNEKKDQILSYYLNGEKVAFHTKMELETQIPALKKRFLKATDFANASFDDLLGDYSVDQAVHLYVDQLASCLYINNGDNTFSIMELDPEMQISTLNAAVAEDFNGDGLLDILTGGNFYENNIQRGRYDGSYGNIMINEGGSKFSVEGLGEKYIRGEVREIQSIEIKNKKMYIVARNNDSLRIMYIK